MKSRKSYAIINTLSLLVKEVIALACNFILPRLIIGYFGSEYNGLISSITQFLNIVSLFRLGVAGAARYSMYKPLANGDGNALSASFNAFQNYMRKIGLIVLMYVVAVAVAYPLVFGREFNFIDVFILVIALGSTVIAQYLFGLMYRSVLEADQKSFILNIVDGGVNVLATVLASILIVFGISLPLVKLFSAVAFLLAPLIIFIIVKKKYKIDRKITPNKQSLKKRKDSMWHSIANIVHENTDVLALTALSTKAAISIYSTYALVITGLKQIVSIFTSTLEAPFGNMFAKNEYKNIEVNLHHFEFLSFSLATVLYSVAFVLILPFISLYIKDVQDVEYIIPAFGILMVLTGITFCLRVPYQTVSHAGGFYKETKWFATFEALINLALTFGLLPFIGLLATAIGTLVANLFRTITYAWFVYRKVLKKPFYEFVQRILLLVLNCFTIVLILNKILSFASIDNWFEFVLFGAIFVVVSLIIVVMNAIVAYKDELRYVFTELFNIKKYYNSLTKRRR